MEDFVVGRHDDEQAIADSAVTTGTDGNSYINGANFSGSTTLTGQGAGDTVNVVEEAFGSQTGFFGPATVAPDGAWTLTLTGLSDGNTYLAQATATDPAGNTAQSSTLFAVATTTSESAISDSAVTTGTDGKSYINAAHFNGGSTTLTGHAQPKAGLEVEAGDTVSVSLNGGAAQAATMAAGGAWSLTLTGLTDGQSYSAVATATDPAGNTASSDPFAFTVDTTTSESAIADSAVTTGTDGNSYINAANFNGGSTTLTGQAEAGDSVNVVEEAFGSEPSSARRPSPGATRTLPSAHRPERREYLSCASDRDGRQHGAEFDLVRGRHDDERERDLGSGGDDGDGRQPYGPFQRRFDDRPCAAGLEVEAQATRFLVS